MAMAKKAVELHSHDFAWEDLARVCEPQIRSHGEAEDGTHGDDEDCGEDGEGEECWGRVAKENWNVFHQKNNGKVYKPRNYLVQEFPELTSMEQDTVQLLELGCGYGSAVFPILAECPKVHAQVCDFSAHAIDILQQNPLYDASRCRAFVCDIAQEEFAGVTPGSIDIVLMVFVMSALLPASFATTLQKVYNALRPGGIVCFRDYGLYDLAMMRNAKMLSKSLYYRSDGTLAYFFSKEDLVEYFERQTGFLPLENEYCTVRLKNRKRNVVMDRVWLHAKFQKPL
uniref:Methyltransferase type 12 domain-containing protein n=1 Tax=Globisporangium ultimum (strain ATCC 200006 / CBS 805.95 / DAOM BR144) TaxID=431595 RepID=K3X6L9_GLOUD